MSTGGHRRVTRASSKGATPQPAARQLRAATQGRNLNSGLPSLLGATSTAYGSPGQAQLARTLTPRKTAAKFFQDLAAKKDADDQSVSSDLNQDELAPARKSPIKRKEAAAARATRAASQPDAQPIPQPPPAKKLAAATQDSKVLPGKAINQYTSDMDVATSESRSRNLQFAHPPVPEIESSTQPRRAQPQRHSKPQLSPQPQPNLEPQPSPELQSSPQSQRSQQSQRIQQSQRRKQSQTSAQQSQRGSDWRWPSKNVLTSLLMTFAAAALVMILTLPWIPYNEKGGIIQDLKYYHDSASSLVPNLFPRPQAPKEELSAFARQIWELRADQQQLRRQYRGYDATVSQMAKNYYDSLNQVNFFSAKLGATVDPFLSSPTRHTLQPSFLDRLVSNYQRREPNPPVAALLPWNEAGDCWCTPPTSSPSSRAQLAVNMPYNVIPQTITIEHHPAQGLLDPGSVPKDFQLWVHVKNDVLRETIAGNTQSPNPEDNDLPEGWVQIASFTYKREPADNNHIQSFDMDYPLERFAAQGLEINKAVVRASSNYGADFTCMYRIRLHGMAVEADTA